MSAEHCRTATDRPMEADRLALLINASSILIRVMGKHIFRSLFDIS